MPSCSRALSRSSSVRGLMPQQERSSCEKRRGPSERSWMQVRVAELAHRVDDREEGLALLRQLVFDAGRRLRIAAPVDDALVLESSEPLGERAGADAAAGALELREATRALGEVMDEQGGPLGADDLGGGS